MATGTEHVSEASEHPETDANDHERLVRVESDIGWIKDKLSHLVPGSHAEAQQREEDRLERPSGIEEQVRAELARARQEEADAAAAEQGKAAAAAEEQSVRDRLARLEQPPAPPRMRRVKFLGWGDGRA